MTNKKEQKNTKETAVITERKPRKLKSLATMLVGVILGMGIMIPVAAGFKNANIEDGLKSEKPTDAEKSRIISLLITAVWCRAKRRNTVFV